MEAKGLQSFEYLIGDLRGEKRNKGEKFMLITSTAGILAMAAVAQEEPKASAESFMNAVVDNAPAAPASAPAPAVAPAADVPAAAVEDAPAIPGAPSIEKRKVKMQSGKVVEMTLAEFTAAMHKASVVDADITKAWDKLPIISIMESRDTFYIKVAGGGTPSIPVEKDAEDFESVPGFIPQLGIGYRLTGPGLTVSAGGYMDFLVNLRRYSKQDGSMMEDSKLRIGVGLEGTIGYCGDVGGGVCLGGEFIAGLGGLMNVTGVDDGSKEGKYPNLLAAKIGLRGILQLKGVELFLQYNPTFQIEIGGSKKQYEPIHMITAGINILTF